MNQDHEHGDFPANDEPGDPFGCPGQHTNGRVLGGLVSAACDRCVPCQTAGLDAIQGDPLTLTRMVELSAGAVMSVAGGIPADMTTEDDAATGLGAGYRAAVRAGLDQDQHAAIYAVIAGLDDAGRRHVAEDALDILAGVLMLGPSLAGGMTVVRVDL